jgi:hypothetical protein
LRPAAGSALGLGAAVAALVFCAYTTGCTPFQQQKLIAENALMDSNRTITRVYRREVHPKGIILITRSFKTSPSYYENN